jgi:hypothetical protein
MATITHGGSGMPAGTVDRYFMGRVMLGVLCTWVLLGPIVGILYEYRIVTREWYPPAAPSMVELTDIQAAYFSNTLWYYFGGAVIWIFGIAILGYLSWRTSVHDD